MTEFPVMDALRALTAQLAAFEALLLTASAVHKLATWSRSLAVIQGFAGVPAAFAGAGLGAAAGGEVIAAVMLAMPGYRTAGGLFAAAIWTVYLTLILRAIVQGRHDVDCGCSFGATRRPLGSFQVVRNSVLLGFAACIAAVSALGGQGLGTGHGLGGLAIQSTQVLAAFALLALYAALDQVMALQPLRSGEIL